MGVKSNSPVERLNAVVRTGLIEGPVEVRESEESWRRASSREVREEKRMWWCSLVAALDLEEEVSEGKLMERTCWRIAVASERLGALMVRGL